MVGRWRLKEQARELIASGMKGKVVCGAMGISKSGYYYRPKGYDRRRRPLDPDLVSDINRLDGYELAYGYRKVTEKLGHYNHKKVLRHTQAMGRTQPRRYKHKRRVHLAAVCPIRSNLRWEADLSYVFDGTQNTYLFGVIDAHDKEIVGEHHGLRCRADEALESLRRGVLNRFGVDRVPEGHELVVRIDQGSQYLAKKFCAGASAMGVRLEYCGINSPNEKPYIESFFAQYKREEVYRNEYRGFADAHGGWERYRQWYNTGRIHQGLGMRTIPDFQLASEKTASQDGLYLTIEGRGKGMVPPSLKINTAPDLQVAASF